MYGDAKSKRLVCSFIKKEQTQSHPLASKYYHFFKKNSRTVYFLGNCSVPKNVPVLSNLLRLKAN